MVAPQCCGYRRTTCEEGLTPVQRSGTRNSRSGRRTVTATARRVPLTNPPVSLDVDVFVRVQDIQALAGRVSFTWWADIREVIWSLNYLGRQPQLQRLSQQRLILQRCLGGSSAVEPRQALATLLREPSV